MIMYNVTVMVEESLSNDWLDWMNQTHIPDVMATGFFLFRIGSVDSWSRHRNRAR